MTQPLSRYYESLLMSDLLESLRVWTLLTIDRGQTRGLIDQAEEHVQAAQHEIIRRCPEPELVRLSAL